MSSLFEQDADCQVIAKAMETAKTPKTFSLTDNYTAERIQTILKTLNNSRQFEARLVKSMGTPALYVSVKEVLDLNNQIIESNDEDEDCNEELFSESYSPTDSLKEDPGTDFSGMGFCFTGFRSAPAKEFIEMNGGKVYESVNSAVTHVITKDIFSTSSKIATARKRGLTILCFAGFTDLYKIKI